MLLRNITSKELIDMSGGVQDIKDGFLRSHRDVDFNEILSQDPLRIMRFVRFSSKYNFKVDDADLECIKANSHRIDIISIERVREELVKLMEIGKLVDAIRFMDEVGILERILPEVSGMKNVFHDPNAPFHKEADGEVFGHVMLVLENAKSGVIPQLSALLHDIGKPPARKVNEHGKVSFKHHEPIGGDMTKILMKRLKFDNATSAVVEKLVRMHTRPHAFGKWNGKQPSDKAVRKLVRDAGDELDLLLDLSEADSLGNDPVVNTVPALRERIKAVMAVSARPISSAPLLSGSEIMQVRGMSKGGPVIRDIILAIQEAEDLTGSLDLEDARRIAREFQG
jgi:poly(A) polymerase